MYELRLDAHKSGKPWVSRITGTDARYSFARQFVAPWHKEFDSKRRLEYAIWHLEDGLYESEERASWSRSEREYFTISNGKRTELTALGMRNLLEKVSKQIPENKRLRQLEALKLVNGYRLKGGYKVVKRKRS